MTQDAQLAGHGGAHDQLLRFVDDVGEGSSLPGEGGICGGHGLFVPLVHEEAADQVEEFVPDRPVHRPAPGKPFPSPEDLLDDDIERAARAARIRCPGVDCLGKPLLLEPPEIPGRVEEAVRMVETHSRHLSLFDEAEDESVCLPEDDGILHADGRQLVDGKEVGVGRTGTVLQNIVPSAIASGRDPHMVGDDVQELPHHAGLQSGDECIVSLSGGDRWPPESGEWAQARP
jgi:hypothetical protein